jgi:hypothetical protein
MMRSINWLNNGTNGDDFGKLFNSWGLGTQVITATPNKDVIFPGTIMYGHIGDASGLISALFTDPVN